MQANPEAIRVSTFKYGLGVQVGFKFTLETGAEKVKEASVNRDVLILSKFCLNLSKLWGVLNLSKFCLIFF
jgi:hypothetical protein